MRLPVRKTLIFLIAIGFFFRIWGIGHGLLTGETYHPDAPKQIGFMRQYLSVGYGLDHAGRDYYGYPSFHIHLAEWIYRILRFFAHMIGYSDWEMNHMGQFLMVRLMLAVMSTATIYFIYRIGAFLFNPAAGLLSSLFFAIHPFSISLTHFVMGDTAMVFFAVVSAFYFSRALKENSLSNYLLGGIFAGFSGGCKYNGIFIIILGIFSLFYNRNRGIFPRLSMLVTGCVLGFVVGTPAIFLGFGEGIKSVINFLDYISHIGVTADVTREKAVWRALPNTIEMFKNIFGLVFSLLSITSAIWVLARRRTAPYIFILLFPFAYLCMVICMLPNMQPRHFLVTFPFLFILMSVFIDSIKRWKIIAYVLTFTLISICSYASLKEVFFFKHPDTRTAAREWIYRNVSPSFRVSRSGYSVNDPYIEYTGEREAGEFFISSYLAGMPVPENGILVKEFSLENRIPIIIHRNPSLKVFVIPGRDIEEGFRIPLFSRSPAREVGTGFTFLNGKDFGIDPLQFQVRPGRKLILVSEEAVERIGISLTNNFGATVVKMKVGWKKKRVSLAPYETRIVLFEHPGRGFPLTKYFYKVYIDKGRDDSQVFVKIGADSYRIGKLYYETGLYGEAIEYLEKVQESYESAILLAICYHEMGQVKKAVDLAKEIEKDFGREYTGISEKVLRDVNTIRFVSGNLTSHRGEIVTDKKASSRKCIAITCKDGEEDCIYGPYYGFPHGSFVARYRLKISDVSGSSKIKIDVAGRLGTKVVAESSLKTQETDGFMSAELPFYIDTAAEILEFRITLTGKGTIVLDYVEVFPDVGATFTCPPDGRRVTPVRVR